MKMNKLDRDSLRRRLLVRLWIPLFMVLILGGIVAFLLARHFGNVVHDRWLYDSVMTLAAQLKLKDGQVALDLPTPAVEMFEWDNIDKIYEEVTSSKRGHLFGNALLPSPPDEMHPGQPFYHDSIVNGHPVRIAAIMLPNPGDSTDTITIQVAETKKKREALVTNIILITVPLQTGILALAGAFIWFAVISSLRTLNDLAARLTRYEPGGLIPIGDTHDSPSEVRPLINAINHLLATLSDAQNTQRRFIANGAHQLRTPLATLQVQAERALRESDPTKHSEALSHVLSAITRLRHVVHQLLTLARSEHSSEQALQMRRMDLAELARDELEKWADAAIARDVDLGYEGPEKGIDIYGEPGLLREMIANLVDNAIRYGRQGGEVTLGLLAEPITLYIDDDGPGIPPEERMLVLERFYRRAETGEEGCGLGLAIAREIAVRHRAHLAIVDRPQSSGTRVEIVFEKYLATQSKKNL